jgi:hypothetical protein
VSKEVIAGRGSLEESKRVKHMMIVALMSNVVVLLQAAAGDEALSDMNDLGLLMLGGFVLAVAGAIALTVIRLKLRDKKPAEPHFVSINSRDEE